MKLLVLIGVICALLLSACGESGNTTAESISSAANSISAKLFRTAAERAAFEAKFSKPHWAGLKSVAAAPGRVLIPSGPEPKRVIVRDLKKGNGKLIRAGVITANYESFSLTGERIERHWGDEAWHWGYGPHSTFKGWAIGLKGMRLGGRRELVVPSDLAYNNGPRIYVIELLKNE